MKKLLISEKAVKVVTKVAQLATSMALIFIIHGGCFGLGSQELPPAGTNRLPAGRYHTYAGHCHRVLTSCLLGIARVFG